MIYARVHMCIFRAQCAYRLRILQVPGPARAWVDRITKRFPFERIISGHFASPIDARPQDFRHAGLPIWSAQGRQAAAWLSAGRGGGHVWVIVTLFGTMTP